MHDESTIRINEALVIPMSELAFTFAGSSGPGGQHVNKTATKAVLRFDVARSPSLSEVQRARLLQTLGTRLDRHGVLQVQAQDTRSQRRNRELAVLRFKALLANGLRTRKKRRKTKPSRAAVERRLADKRRRSERKRDRRRRHNDSA